MSQVDPQSMLAQISVIAQQFLARVFAWQTHLG
jgi:hypothetical protein